MGVRGVVKKERWLYMVGQTRVHVDDVQGLGHFMELEVSLGCNVFVTGCRSSVYVLPIVYKTGL